MKEIEMWLKGGGSFVLQLGEYGGELMIAEWTKGPEGKCVGRDKIRQVDGSVLLIDWSEVAALDVRDAQQVTEAGFVPAPSGGEK